MNDIAIRCEGLSKQYRIGRREPYKTLRDALVEIGSVPLQKLRSLLNHSGGQPGASANTIWALKDVSFEVKRGEALGIIGPNGAGKSTLLKILSRITTPTDGYAEINGRIASLLEVGTGFHSELSGRENIYLNGAILGMKRAEIASKFDEIVAFAEVEDFIDTPVKHYSSGMYLRLAFAVAAHLEPEILLIDEALAVGDARFQNKCLGKIGDVARSGRTVLFVSHNMGAVRQICRQGLFLREGRIAFLGSASDCIKEYLASGSSDCAGILSHISKLHPDVEVTSISVNGSADDQVSIACNSRILDVKFEGSLSRPLRIEIEAVVTDLFENRLAFFSPGHERGYTDIHPAGPFCIARRIELPDRMNRGEYYLNLYLTDPNVAGWVEVHRGVRLSTEGTPTRAGRVLEYQNGAGWIFLSEPDRSPDYSAAETGAGDQL